jgi:hypothetical protein
MIQWGIGWGLNIAISSRNWKIEGYGTGYERPGGIGRVSRSIGRHGRTASLRRSSPKQSLVNQMEIEIDNKAASLLALHQPMAGDLRLITAAIKSIPI